jgi:hypothetical protein
VQITIEGGTHLAKVLEAARQSGPGALMAALYQEAEDIMTVAKQDYVPVDTGALRASGFVEPPVGSGENASITLGFGSDAVGYAVLVHEDLTKRHKVGQAKYLEIPLRAAAQGMEAVLAQRVRDVLQQAAQRAAKVESNLAAGRDPNAGMPLFR